MISLWVTKFHDKAILGKNYAQFGEPGDVKFTPLAISVDKSSVSSQLQNLLGAQACPAV